MPNSNRLLSLHHRQAHAISWSWLVYFGINYGTGERPGKFLFLLNAAFLISVSAVLMATLTVRGQFPRVASCPGVAREAKAALSLAFHTALRGACVHLCGHARREAKASPRVLPGNPVHSRFTALFFL